jgi:hypothetical protein
MPNIGDSKPDESGAIGNTCIEKNEPLPEGRVFDGDALAGVESRKPNARG